jgi:hypothetical protein
LTRAPSSEKKEAAYKVGSIRGATEQKSVGVPIRAASDRPRGNIRKNLNFKSSAGQGAFISDKIRDAPRPNGAMDGNSGGSKVSEGMSNKDNCGAAGTKELNIFPTKCKAFIFDMGISTASVFLSNEVCKLATKYQAWHKLTANENQSTGRPASKITTYCARIYLVKMRNKIRDSLKTDNVPGHKESRQGQTCMANALDPRNKTNSLQRAQVGSTVVKEIRSASSGFSLTPESRPSAAAVEAEKHYPKMAGNKQEYWHQVQGNGMEWTDMICPSN